MKMIRYGTKQISTFYSFKKVNNIQCCTIYSFCWKILIFLIHPYQVYVSTVQAHSYPVTAFQWHPEVGVVLHLLFADFVPAAGLRDEWSGLLNVHLTLIHISSELFSKYYSDGENVVGIVFNILASIWLEMIWKNVSIL